jgi:hypothetical protein
MSDEKVARRARHLLAIKYFKIVKSKAEAAFLEPSLSNRWATFASDNYQYLLYAVVWILLIGTFTSGPRLVEGWTHPRDLQQSYLVEQFPRVWPRPVTEEGLAQFLHEDSRYGTDGAICRDEWVSQSTGSGTCSHHKGVKRWYRKYSRTLSDCQDQAEKAFAATETRAFERSWRD